MITKIPPPTPAEKQMKAIMYNFGRKVRRMRRDRGQTLLQMATQLGISFNHLSDIEHGKRNLTLPTIFDLCGTLGIKCAVVFSLE